MRTFLDTAKRKWRSESGCVIDQHRNLVAVRYSLSRVDGNGHQVVANDAVAIRLVEADENMKLMAASPRLYEGCMAALAYLTDPASTFEENRIAAMEIIQEAVRLAEKGSA